MCMVYRPRPARIFSLNPSSWMLLELCNGATVKEIEDAYAGLLAGRGHRTHARDVHKGLEELVEYELIDIGPTNDGDRDKTEE
jgi:hypothetical protein